MLPLQGAWVPSLVWELRSHKPWNVAKKTPKVINIVKVDLALWVLVIGICSFLLLASSNLTIWQKVSQISQLPI